MSDHQNPTNLLGNRYRLEHILGRGGMSIVYKAYDVTLERPVAVKVLRQDYSDNSEFQKSFHQEAKAAANLTHPNIVTIHDFG
ncbi:MAG: protein kinase, partial [bacterium]